MSQNSQQSCDLSLGQRSSGVVNRPRCITCVSSKVTEQYQFAQTSNVNIFFTSASKNERQNARNTNVPSLYPCCLVQSKNGMVCGKLSVACKAAFEVRLCNSLLVTLLNLFGKPYRSLGYRNMLRCRCRFIFFRFISSQQVFNVTLHAASIESLKQTIAQAGLILAF